jgi:hypothetical protein
MDEDFTFMRALQLGFAITLIALGSAVHAQTTPEPPPPPTSTPPPPFVGVETTAGGYERTDALPSLNVYLPEGQASIRLRKLIKNVLFESQIDYRFVTGDISTFLRYKYYARNFTYRLGVFDQIGFPEVGSQSTNNNEFQRVRGGLLLFGFPRDYNRRYFWLLQDDRLTFGNLVNIDNKTNNIYTKLGYQYGTQFDERMNGIVGESRGRITPVLTAFRDIGPQKTGLAAAITESLKVSTGDYHYTKFEAEGLHRTDVTATTFIFSRLHLGAFFGYDKCATFVLCRGQQNVTPIESYSIPLYEMFQLGGRDALKGVGASDAATGTHEVHLTNEFFVPIFRNRDYRWRQVHWNTMYGIGYLGAGTVGLSASDAFKSGQTVVDAGLGSEMAITVRDFDVLLSVVYAHTVEAPDALKGSKVRFFIRTVR